MRYLLSPVTSGRNIDRMRYWLVSDFWRKFIFTAMNAGRMVAWETSVQSDRRVRRWGAEIVGAGEDIGFARVASLGRPRDRCWSYSLGHRHTFIRA